MQFKDKRNLEIIGNAVQFLEKRDFDNSLKSRVDIIVEILESIKVHPESWDEKCSFNLEFIGDSYIDFLVKLNSIKIEEETINELYLLSYRFLLELEFNLNGKMNNRFRRIANKIQKDITAPDNVNEQLKSDFIYATYLMPSHITRELIHNEKINDIKEFNRLHQVAINEKANWEKFLKEEREKAEELKKTLKDYETGFNFVGLYDGFNDLRKSKNKEKSLLILLLCLTGLLMLTVPSAEAYYIILNLQTIESIKDHIILSFIPLATIEIILIYFFRIFLHNYKSTKSQLMQIDLRRTLCQFIQSYSDYSVKLKSKGDSSLEKFENIIFSGIVSSDEQLPSTYDGLNQLIDLITKVKKT